LNYPLLALGRFFYKTIAVAPPKGGRGKTTTSISLAAGSAHQGKKGLPVVCRLPGVNLAVTFYAAAEQHTNT
jgi:MinD-like ATPase involved in chromosome partitioning or flagellar assembly